MKLTVFVLYSMLLYKQEALGTLAVIPTTATVIVSNAATGDEKSKFIDLR